MLNHAEIKVNVIEVKKKIFAHVVLTGKKPVKSSQVKEYLKSLGHDVGDLKAGNDVKEGKGLFVFDIGDGVVEKKSRFKEAVENLQKEQVGMTDLTLSYGASELEPAPEEITNPKPEIVEEESKTTRRTRKTTTRKPRTRRATKTTSKEPAE